MTGRDLIIYILSNGLEDEPIFKDGKIPGFLTVEEAAVKMNVGTGTVKTMIRIHAIDYIHIGETFYIPAGFEKSFARKE